jgi:hypothetical protein
LPEFIRDLLIGDHALLFRQLAPTDLHTFLRGVFSWVDEAVMQSQLGWTIDDVVKFAEVTLKGEVSKQVNSVFSRRRLRRSGIVDTTLTTMLPAFTHAANAINSHYVTPADADKADALLKPLGRLPDGGLAITVPSIAAIAFYEATATALRPIFHNVDGNIGTSAEGVLADAVRARQIVPSAVSNKFKFGSKALECDLLLEFKQDPSLRT